MPNDRERRERIQFPYGANRQRKLSGNEPPSQPFLPTPAVVNPIPLTPARPPFIRPGSVTEFFRWRPVLMIASIAGSHGPLTDSSRGYHAHHRPAARPAPGRGPRPGAVRP